MTIYVPTLRGFISGKYKDIFNKFKTTLKQHIKDGIPLPLDTVGRLNRMITVRGGL